jgi:hypothetical protein
MHPDAPVTFPPVAAGEPIVLSASSFVAFERCQEQAAGRLRGVFGAESRRSFSGGLAHRIFARHLNGGEIPPEEFAAACREEIGASMNPKLASLGLKPSELSSVIEEVGSLYQRFRTLGRAGFVGAEVALEVEPSDGVRLRGAVDAVFDDGAAGVRLVDWKTGSVGDPGAQLGFYALLWALERGEVPGRVEALSVGTGERVEEVPSRSGLTDIAVRAAAAVDALRGAWAASVALPTTAGPWCRWCPLLDGCDDGRSASELLG